jgi:hypothetical protein
MGLILQLPVEVLWEAGNIRRRKGNPVKAHTVPVRPFSFRPFAVLILALFGIMVFGLPASSRTLAPGVESQEATAGKHSKKQEKVEVAYPEAVGEATRNAIPDGKASLYVLRPWKVVGSAGCFTIYTDNQLWGCLPNGRYFYDSLSTGEHFFTRERGCDDVQVEAGHTYYAVLSAGGWGGNGGLKLLSVAEGEEQRKKLSLDPYRWLLNQYHANWASLKIGMSSSETMKLLNMADGGTEGSFELPGGMFFHGVGGGFFWTGTGKGVATYTGVLGYKLVFRDRAVAAKVDAPPAAMIRNCPK